jgi:Putative zinc-finger
MSAQDHGSRVALPESDRYLQWDAAYVLGALSSAERREFEQHLSGCRGCQRGVSEIAGMPGLLAQASPEDAAMLFGAQVEELDAEPAPGVAALVAEARRRRRRRLLVTVGSIAAALVLVAGGLSVLVFRGLTPIGAEPPYRVAFTPVVPNGITAVVDVTPGSDQTGLHLECQYARTADPLHHGSYGDYAIWVRDRSGRESELYAWPAKPNKVMRPKATAPVPTRRLDRVEIRAADTGELLLTAPLH